MNYMDLMDKKELTKKNWALLYIPYGSIIHALTYISENTTQMQVRTNAYINEALARNSQGIGDTISILSIKRARKPTVKEFIRTITNKYKFYETYTSFEEMIKLDFRDTEDADIFISNSPLLLDLFEVVEIKND
jgi:hypothetical protein